MQINQVKETCLYVQNLDRTQNFYQEIIGLECIGRVDGRHIFFRAGTSVLLCFIAEETLKGEKLPAHGGEGKLHIALEIASGAYQQCLQEIRLAGISVEHEQVWGNGRRSFYFRDPDDHLIELIEPGAWD